MLPFHPLAEVLPLLEKKQYEELAADIKAQGLLEPITLYEDKILDGRNRYRACLDAAIKPTTEEYKGDNPIAFVLSKNLHRRHLTVGQRAMAVAKYAKLGRGGNPRTRRLEATIPYIAKLANVGTRAIEAAKLIHANGTEKEIADVVAGRSSLRKAEKKARAHKQAKIAKTIQEQKRPSAGARIAIPKGFPSISDAVRAGIKAERAGATPPEAAKASSLAFHTYITARDIVLLADRDTLSSKDTAIVKQAMHCLDVDRTIQSSLKSIRPIIIKVWGRKGHRFKADKQRLEHFSNAISYVWSTCTTAAELDIPPLANGQREEAITQLTEAMQALVQFRKRVKGDV